MDDVLGFEPANRLAPVAPHCSDAQITADPNVPGEAEVSLDVEAGIDDGSHAGVLVSNHVGGTTEIFVNGSAGRSFTAVSGTCGLRGCLGW